MEGAHALERPHHLGQVFRRGLVPDRHAGRHLQRKRTIVLDLRLDDARLDNVYGTA